MDIGLAGSEPGRPSTTGPIVQFDSFENEGYYVFLHPWFARLAEETGQYIDLFGDAEFHGEALRSLRQTVLDARRSVENQPAQWTVFIGTATMPNAPDPPPPWDVIKGVDRSKLLALLHSLLAIVDRAISTGVGVVCFGD